MQENWKSALLEFSGLSQLCFAASKDPKVDLECGITSMRGRQDERGRKNNSPSIPPKPKTGFLTIR